MKIFNFSKKEPIHNCSLVDWFLSIKNRKHDLKEEATLIVLNYKRNG